MCEVFWDDISDKNIEIDEVVSDARTLNDKAASMSPNHKHPLILGFLNTSPIQPTP